jgi:type VI protein secretion system component Hcp
MDANNAVVSKTQIIEIPKYDIKTDVQNAALLTLKNIDGMVTKAGVSNAIAVYEFWTGLYNPANVGSGSGPSGGVPRAQDTIIYAMAGSHSANILLYAASGKVISEATLNVLSTGAGDAQSVVYQWTYTNAYITSYSSIFGQTTNSVLDVFTLAYSQIKLTANYPKIDGSAGSKVEHTFDVSTGKAS